MADFISYFGYGSLVNRATHRTDIIQAAPTRLQGWRRVWLPSPTLPAMNVALLSVRPELESAIDGLLIQDHRRNLSSLDEREVYYKRQSLDRIAFPAIAPFVGAADIFIYQAHAESVLPNPSAPILQSYLDAVLQGFFAEFGEQGVANFIFETDNFDTPILPDRDRPLYPRAVQLPDGERRMIDGMLAERKVRYLEPGTVGS